MTLKEIAHSKSHICGIALLYVSAYDVDANMARLKGYFESNKIPKLLFQSTESN